MGQKQTAGGQPAALAKSDNETMDSYPHATTSYPLSQASGAVGRLIDRSLALEELYQVWTLSGLSQADFCSQQGVKLSRLKYAIKRHCGEINGHGDL